MGKFQVNLIIEIMGRPPEHVKEALRNLSTRIGSEKGVKIKSQEIHDPIQVEEGKDLYTAFIELSLEIESLSTFTAIIFTYMPSNIELVSPEKIELSNVELNELGNAITQRLHHYDAVTKQILTEKDILLKRLYEFAPHLFKKQEQGKQSQQQVKISKKSNKKSTNKKAKKRK